MKPYVTYFFWGAILMSCRLVFANMPELKSDVTIDFPLGLSLEIKLKREADIRGLIWDLWNTKKLRARYGNLLDQRRREICRRISCHAKQRQCLGNQNITSSESY